ncbi:MAG: hypothetical protein IT210_03155 [Armatimonadetes bacterium]|nr:hypothetical protein [Armatimonadota bacterium]
MTPAEAILHENLPVIEVADQSILDTLLTDSATFQCILIRLSDRAAVVAPGRFEVLLGRLLKLGHLPKVLEE